MSKRGVLPIIGILVLLAGVTASAQVERYDRKFFLQLRTVFGRFRDSDLQRVFEAARPIPCSELVNDEGEWRTVAFFNEKRELGDWYRRDFDEVKKDLAVYIFKGVCRGEHGPVQLTTKFPVTESIEAYNQDRIPLDEVAVNTNAAVRASFDSQTQAYTFDLPYLFLISEQDHERLYSLDAPRLLDRYRYATDVIDHWDCKSVAAENVTYQFLICRTLTLPRSVAERNASRPAFGAAAYFILSDGKEASSSVKLSFGDDSTISVPNDTGSAPPAAPASWEAPESDEKILDILREEFRIRFAPQSWTGRVGSSQVLSAKRMTTLASATPAQGADYCIWLPGSASAVNYLLSDQPVEYSIKPRNQDGQSSTSIAFDINTPATGVHLGKLECFFPRVSNATTIDFRRWTTIVGDHVVLEVRP